MPARMKLCTNCRWNSRKATSSGADVSRVAAVMMDQSTPWSTDENTCSPTVSGRAFWLLVTISGQRKLFQWKLTDTSANAVYTGLASGTYTRHSVCNAPAPSMRVRVWSSVVDAVPASAEADRFLSEYLGTPCRLVYMPESTRRTSNPDYAGDANRLVGFADGEAFLIANLASLDDLNARLAAKGHPPLPMNRFRPNIVVTGAAPYAEDGWGELRLGDAVVRAAKPCGRCQVTTTDQATGEVRGPEPLATLSTFRESGEFGVMFGMNLVTVREGSIRVGDTVELA